MSGIAITHESNVEDLLATMRAASVEIRPALERALAEQAIEYNQDLRGVGPGLGVTPFATGRLLTSGNIEQHGLNLEFVNEAQAPGGQPYAEWARKAGEPIGGYKRDSGEAFARRFGPELEEAWSKLMIAALEGALVGR